MANVVLRTDGGKEIVGLPPVCMKCGAPATVRESKQFSWLPPKPVGESSGLWAIILLVSLSAIGAFLFVLLASTNMWGVCDVWGGWPIILFPLAYFVGIIIVTFVLLRTRLKRQLRTVVIETTFCDEHKHYWQLYPVAAWLSSHPEVARLLPPMLPGGLMMLVFILPMILRRIVPDRILVLANVVVVLTVAIVVNVVAVVLYLAVRRNVLRIGPTEITDRHIHLTGVSAEFADAVEKMEARERSASDRADDPPR